MGRKGRHGKGKGPHPSEPEGSRPQTPMPTPPPPPPPEPVEEEPLDVNVATPPRGPQHVAAAERSFEGDNGSDVSLPLSSVTTNRRGEPRLGTEWTPHHDPEMEQFVEEESRELEDCIVPDAMLLEQQTAVNTESAKRTMIKFDEELNRRKLTNAFIKERREILEKELAEAAAVEREVRSRLNSASSTPQRSRGTPQHTASASRKSSPASVSLDQRPQRGTTDVEAPTFAPSLQQDTQVFVGESPLVAASATRLRKLEEGSGTFLAQVPEAAAKDVTAPPSQQPQQTQQQHFYGAAALPVESSSEALDKAAKVSQQGPYQTGRDSGATTSSSRDKAAVLPPSPRPSTLTTRQTNYAALQAAKEAEALAGTARPLSMDGGDRNRLRNGGLASPSNGSLGRFPHTSPLRSHPNVYCEMQEREMQKARVYFWPLVVAPPLSYDEQQEAAYYLPFRDNHFYCYNLEAEMPAMQAITVDQAAEAAAEGTLCTPVTRNLPVHSHYGAVDDARSGASSPSPMYTSLSPPPPPLYSSPSSRREQEVSHGSGLSLLPGMNVNGAEYADVVQGGVSHQQAHKHRYHIPQMRRVWATTVLRQFLLFSLSSLLLIMLFVPTVVRGSLLDIYDAGRNRDYFFSSRNRFGASAAMSSLELVAAEVVLVLVAVVSLAVARHATSVGAHGADDVHREEVAVEEAHNHERGLSRAWLFLLSPRLLLLAGVSFAAAGSNLLFYAGLEDQVSVATVAQLLSGGGRALAILGVFAMASAEVGIVAGIVAVLALCVPAWLLAAAADFFILPYVLDSWVTSAQALHGITILETSALLFAVALALLLPADVLERAAVVNVPYFAPSALYKASKEISPRFVLRVLSVSLLAAALLCMAICATPIMTQRSASGGRVQSELVPVDPRHAVSFMFLAALCVWPFCLVPTSAAWVNRMLPSSLLTLGLALLWLAYAVLDPPFAGGAVINVLQSPAPTQAPRNFEDDGLGMMDSSAHGDGSGTGSTNGAKTDKADKHGGKSTTVPRALTPSRLSRMAGYLLTPSLCAILTGAVFALVAASVVRSIANSGATLPIHPRHKRRHPHRSQLNPLYHRYPSSTSNASPATQKPRTPSPNAASASASPTESDGLLQHAHHAHGEGHHCRSLSPLSPGSADGASDGAETQRNTTHSGKEDGPGVGHGVDCESIRARFIFQRRGGPSAVLVLTLLLASVCLCVCAFAQAATAALLTDLYRTPRNAVSIADDVQVDQHQSLLWMVAGLTGLAAFFEACIVVFGMWINVQRHRMEI